MKILKPMRRAIGGIHPRYHKELAADQPILELPLPERLRVSMSQHMGAPARPLVKKGDAVKRGQLIGEAVGFISARVHAPASGTVAAVVDAPTAAGGEAPAVEIDCDGADAWAGDLAPLAGWESVDPRQLLARVTEAGIVGMGGAGFPTHVKLSPPPEKRIDTLIINGAECEPYLAADHRLMVEHAAFVLQGSLILRRILGARTLRIAIESNKPDAIRAFEQAAGADGDAAVLELPSCYPQGAEKQQIYAATGRQVPSGGLPMDVGCVVENVATTLAVWDAVVNGRPLTERVTTVSGSLVGRPGNVRARIGTSYQALFGFCGGITGRAAKILSGGPMMGLAQHSLETTSTKTTSGLLALGPRECRAFSSSACIACARCVGACPSRLLPCEISQMIEAEDFEGAERCKVMDCIECGCCAYECPAHRPLVQHMRQGKAHVARKRAARKAETK